MQQTRVHAGEMSRMIKPTRLPHPPKWFLSSYNFLWDRLTDLTAPRSYDPLMQESAEMHRYTWGICDHLWSGTTQLHPIRYKTKTHGTAEPSDRKDNYCKWP